MCIWSTGRRRIGSARNVEPGVRLYDHQEERQWRHLDTCQYQTILHARPPRTNCAEHGVRGAKLPWAEPASRFTALLERLVIDWLRTASQKAVGEQLGLSWDEIHGILQRGVERGLKRRAAEPLPRLGVDEKAFRKGHKYFTLVNESGTRARESVERASVRWFSAC